MISDNLDIDSDQQKRPAIKLTRYLSLEGGELNVQMKNQLR